MQISVTFGVVHDILNLPLDTVIPLKASMHGIPKNFNNVAAILGDGSQTLHKNNKLIPQREADVTSTLFAGEVPMGAPEKISPLGIFGVEYV